MFTLNENNGEVFMQKRMLGELQVSALGLGCMGMSEFYGSTDDARSVETLLKAYENGITFFDTADMYGHGSNEILLGKTVKPFREKIVIATKFGLVRKKEDPHFRKIEGSPNYVKKSCDESLKRLGTDHIDLYYQHRVDPDTPIEETIEAMASLVKAGKVRTIGLSEAPSEIIRRAHAVHPITAVQSEYSLWTRDPEKDVLCTCDELGIGFVAYSPIGRGFFSGNIKSSKDLPQNDFRRTLPRFQEENYQHNMKIVANLKELACHKGCTPSQLALAWVLARSPHVVPIPGTTRPEHLQENIESLKINLTPADLIMINEMIPINCVQGERYAEQSMRIYKFDK